MEKIKMGIIGYGCRSYGMTDILLGFDDVEIIAVCDKYADRVENAVKRVEEKSGKKPFGTQNYKELLAMDEVQAVYIATDWNMHFPIAIDALKAGKATALEVGGAYSVEDCWALVDAQEKSGAQFMFMENCCYNRDELLATAIARTGKFGKIVHLSGAYSHDLRGEVTGGKENRHYRLEEYLHRNCENYPTHELGPMAKVLNINRGNRMTSLVSVATGSFGMEEYVESCKDTIKNKDLIGVDFAQGDVVNTIITCENGETMALRLDTSLPRSYNREFTIRGTKGMYEQNTNSVYFDGQPEFWSSIDYINKYLNSAEQFKDLLPYEWKIITPEALEAGHGGMDYVELREFVDRVKDGGEMQCDVYDAAAWMVVSCLSEESIKNNGKPMEIPDFTRGAYKTREPKDVLTFGKSENE
ncbi:MAG: Gfo/Idh/MocA family oxidoreductase [Ruminococcaceae bacterium]|nr:Gfo/Idh/MocA family oxidoreductase [Oscillospiraceae bacterium]